MGIFLVYIIKSALCLALLYLPYTLLMNRDTFFAFNRKVLLSMMALSLILPAFNIPIFDNTIFSSLAIGRSALIEIGMPTVVHEHAGDMQHQVAMVAEEHSRILIVQLLGLVYIIGVIVCLIWKVVQLVRMLKFMSSGCLWTEVQDGVKVYCHINNVSPFSWMNNVVISEEDYNQQSLIMLHEKAHIKKRHSLDNLAVSLMEVLMWFNPCVWMLDYSLQEVHEYEADDEVLRQGTTAKNYQMLLIKKAISTSSYTFANGFNHSLLKKRITMMLKKESNGWSRTKALYLLPVAMVALGAFATPEFVNTTEVVNGSKVSENLSVNQQISQENEVGKSGIVQETLNVNSELTMQDVEKQIVMEEAYADSVVPKHKLDPNEEVFNVVEVMPEFPGGMTALMAYLGGNVKYPALALENSVEGRVIVQFVVLNDGNIADVHVLTNAAKSGVEKALVEVPAEKQADVRAAWLAGAEALEAEAVRVVEGMPIWEPGKQKGKNVNVKFSVPITFRLK